MTDDQAAENQILTDRAREKVEAYMRELQRERYDAAAGSYVVTADYSKSLIDWQNIHESENLNFFCGCLILGGLVVIGLQGVVQ